MKKITTLLKGSRCPLIIYMDKKETASTESVETNVFQDKANGFALVTNLAAPKSIVGGDAPVKVDGVSEKIDVASFLRSEEISHLIDSEGNHVYMDVELAFDLAKETIHSPLTGNKVTIAYADEESVVTDDEEEDEEETDDESTDESEDDTSEDDSSDESSDGSDDESDSTDADESSEEDETVAEDDADVGDVIDDSAVTEDDDSSDESTDESEEDTSESEDEEEESEEDTTDEDDEMAVDQPVDPAKVAETEIEVSMLDMVDASKAIRLVAANSDASEIAAFVGGIPVGKLCAADASETAAFLYGRDNDKKLFHTFKDRFQHAAKTGNFAELSSLGFTPYTATTKVSALVEKYTEQATAAARSEIASERNVGIERHKKVVNLAMVGILKGLFDKDTNPIVKEVSALLRQNGHKAPEATARRVLTASAGAFTKSVFERAEALSKESDEYLNGTSAAVASADFKASEDETVNPGKLTTVFGSPKPASETAAEEGFVGRTATKPASNRFDKVVAGLGLGRRRF